MAKKKEDDASSSDADTKKELSAADIAAKASQEKMDKIETIVVSKKLNKKYGKVATLEIKQRDPFIPNGIEQKIREEVPKMRGVSANELAQRYDIRVSTVKKLLLDMEREGLVERSTSSFRIKVFNGKGLTSSN
mgnify:CR=1 FL=1